MKKISLMLLTVSTVCLVFSSCSKKMHPNQMAKTPAPKPANEAAMVPFTKTKKQQLERNNADIRQLQFYIDQEIILRRMVGNTHETVKGGNIVRETNGSTSEIVIPAMTPVVCERVGEDSLMISFEAPGNNIPFGALYGSNTFSILGTNWINGSADVQYKNETYRVICGSCGNIAEVKLMVKESNIEKPTSVAKPISGRKVGAR